MIQTYFQIYQVTKEDLQKTQQYKENAIRQHEQAKFADYNDYLRSLDIHLDIREGDEYFVTRIAQMTQKNSQFNLTTRRYTAS